MFCCKNNSSLIRTGRGQMDTLNRNCFQNIYNPPHKKCKTKKPPHTSGNRNKRGRKFLSAPVFCFKPKICNGFELNQSKRKKENRVMSVSATHWKGQLSFVTASLTFNVCVDGGIVQQQENFVNAEFVEGFKKILRSIIFGLGLWKNIFLSIYITTSERKNVPDFWKKVEKIFFASHLPPRRKSFFFWVLLNYYILTWRFFW